MAEAEPGRQGAGSAEPTEQLLPAGHGMQSDRAFKPVTLEYLPAGQGCGIELPTGQKEPSGQGCALMVDARWMRLGRKTLMGTFRHSQS